MIHPEYRYLDLLAECARRGDPRIDRTGVGARSLFGRHLRFDLSEGFPLLTTKRVHFRAVAEELFWMLRGDTNVRSLQAAGVGIWDEWAHPANGDLGPVYGQQWRAWTQYDTWGDGLGSPTPPDVDQIAALITGLRTAPFSRRHLVSAWNVAQLPDMALPPCHFAFQFHMTRSRRLSCQVYQRSADVFLGLPFNIASYALLTHLVAQVTGCVPGDLIMALGDVHLYDNHHDAAADQLERVPDWPFPDIEFPVRGELDDYSAADIQLIGYRSHPAIRAEVAV